MCCATRVGHETSLHRFAALPCNPTAPVPPRCLPLPYYLFYQLRCVTAAISNCTTTSSSNQPVVVWFTAFVSSAFPPDSCRGQTPSSKDWRVGSRRQNPLSGLGKERLHSFLKKGHILEEKLNWWGGDGAERQKGSFCCSLSTLVWSVARSWWHNALHQFQQCCSSLASSLSITPDFSQTPVISSQAMHCCKINYLVQCPPQEAGLHAGAWGEGGEGGGGRREGEGEGGGEGDEWRPSLTPQHHMSVTNPLWKPPKARSIIVWIYQTITGCLCADDRLGWCNMRGLTRCKVLQWWPEQNANLWSINSSPPSVRFHASE